MELARRGSSSNLSSSTSAGLEDNLGVVVSSSMLCVGVLLSCFSLLTVLGNSLVIVSVIRERQLRSVTNYFIVSLAAADLVMGSLVMPFAISQEVLHGTWLYGRLWCDLWHATDVWSSTCSILNLCAIAVERYYAINNPILHAARISRKRSGFTIGLVWLLSASISFPAILWWRASLQHQQPQQPSYCLFTTNSAYLVLSSLLSFYGPLLVMIVVYYRIYRIANATLKSMKTGFRVIKDKSDGGKDNEVILNVHVGGGGGGRSGSRNPSITTYQPDDNRSPTSDELHSLASPVRDHIFLKKQRRFSSHLQDSNLLNPLHCRSPVAVTATRFSSCDIFSDSGSHHQARSSVCSPVRTLNEKLQHMAPPRKRSKKFVRDQRAAKTLGIVMGIFVLCWLPFFICNIIFAINKDLFTDSLLSSIIVSLVTWLGYVNSSINPIIYAHSMRDFRMAFLKILRCSDIRRWLNRKDLMKYYYKNSSVLASDIYKSRSLLDVNNLTGSSLEIKLQEEKHRTDI